MVMSLAGTWTFTPSGAAATTIAVPGGGWVAQGFRSTNEANYQRMAMVPNLGRAQATYLEFGAINHQATLTVDSTMVGTQTTSFTPSVWDVTSVVKPGMSHSFTVDVKGRNALKGSSGKKLVPDAPVVGQRAAGDLPVRHPARRPALHVFETLVRTDVAADKFSIDVWVKNDGASAATGTVDVGLSSWTCDGTTYPSVPSKSVSVPAGQTVKVTLGPITWGLGATSYWWPNVPYVQGYRAKLHVARVTVTPDAAGGGAAAAHSIPVRFGFRQSRQVTAHYELNGVPIKFRGDNVQGADYDSIKTAGAKDNSDAVRPVPRLLAAVGQQSGLAAGRG
jgi:Beta-galactosidase/beta-glucuronidase